MEMCVGAFAHTNAILILHVWLGQEIGRAKPTLECEILAYANSIHDEDLCALISIG
jgi:hypothetical protein